MPEITTPDSIPSLGDVTAASSDTEENARDDVTRVLFPSLHQRKWDNFLARMKAAPAKDGERESLLDSDHSNLGSDQSVAFLDLAVDASSIVGAQVEKTQTQPGNLVRINSDSKLSDVDARVGKGQATPPSTSDPFARFTGPLSASQLASIFSLCDGGEGVIWSKSPTIDKTSPMDDHPRRNVTIQEPNKTNYTGISWMPRAQSLARECATLKEIIRVDSANILQLRQGLDHLKNINKEQVSQIELLRTHLLETRNKIDFLEREKEMLQLRDAENQGTISLLKEELNNLSQAKQSWLQEEQDNDFIANDLEQLRFENELFASQVVDNEKQLKAVKLLLKEIEAENVQLKHEVEMLRTSLDQATLSRGPIQVDGRDGAAAQLLKQVAILSARFDQGEEERLTMALAFDEKLREKDKEIENIRGLLEQDLVEHQRVVPVTSEQGETELQLQTTKRVRKKSAKVDPASDKTDPEQKNECGAWRLLSDCLPG